MADLTTIPLPTPDGDGSRSAARSRATSAKTPTGGRRQGLQQSSESIYLRRRGIWFTIPRKANECRTGIFDRAVYRERNRIERLINRLKQCRRIATRYAKRTHNFLAMLTIAAIFLWL